MTSHITTGSVGGTAPLCLVSIPKASGVLTAIGIAGGPGYHYFEVTIDGTALSASYLSGILSGPSHGNNGLGVGLPFEQSLDVTVRNTKVYPQARFWVSYITDGSRIVDEEHFAGTADNIEYDYIRRVYQASANTAPYLVESLIGPRRWSLIELEQDVLFPGDNLAGQLRIVNGADDLPSAFAVSLILQLPGTTRSILRRELGDVQISRPFIWPSGSLESALSNVLRAPPFARPRPFEMQIAADIPGFVNYPTGFSLL